jgi:hypothetical protein
MYDSLLSVGTALNMLMVTSWSTPTGLGPIVMLLYVGISVPGGGLAQNAIVANVEVVSKSVINIEIVLDILFFIFLFPFLFFVEFELLQATVFPELVV